MWKAKNKFGVVVRTKMNAHEVMKFVSKNKGYTFEKESERTNNEIIALVCMALAFIVQLIIILK